MPYIIEIEPREDAALHAILTHAETGEVIELESCSCDAPGCNPNADAATLLDALWAEIREIVLAAS